MSVMCVQAIHRRVCAWVGGIIHCLTVWLAASQGCQEQPADVAAVDGEPDQTDVIVCTGVLWLSSDCAKHTDIVWLVKTNMVRVKCVISGRWCCRSVASNRLSSMPLWIGNLTALLDLCVICVCVCV